MYFDPDLIRQKLKAITALQNCTNYQPAKEIKKLTDKAIKKQKAAIKKDNAEMVKRIKGVAKARQVKHPPKREKVFAKKDFNPADYIKVEIDAKTTVYMKPGDDPERIRAKYKSKPLHDPYANLPPTYQF